MRQEDQDIDQWARQLAGDKSAGSSPEIDALRDAIRAQDGAVQASTAADELARARLMKRLEDEGLFDDRSASSVRPNLRWQPWVGAAAAVLIAVVGLRVMLPSDEFVLPPEERNRGTSNPAISGNVTITSEQPESSATEILEQLQALGFRPRRLEEDKRIIIELEVSEDQLGIFQEWAAERGRVLTAGVYRVFIVSKAR